MYHRCTRMFYIQKLWHKLQLFISNDQRAVIWRVNLHISKCPNVMEPLRATTLCGCHLSSSNQSFLYPPRPNTLTCSISCLPPRLWTRGLSLKQTGNGCNMRLPWGMPWICLSNKKKNEGLVFLPCMVNQSWNGEKPTCPPFCLSYWLKNCRIESTFYLVCHPVTRRKA